MTDKHVCICKYMKHTYKHTQVYAENDGKWKAEIEALFMKENKFVLVEVDRKRERERERNPLQPTANISIIPQYYR